GAWRQAVHRDSVRRRRLGRYWSCRRADGSYRRPGRRWSLGVLEELHIARRPAHGVCAALKPRGCPTRCRSRSRIYPRSGAITVRRRPTGGACQAKDISVRHVVVALIMAAGLSVVGASLAFADGSGNPAAVKNEDGKYYDKEGNPTFKVQSDGTVDWFTYSGFRRYHSDCHVCHGPDGEGSSYAPALSHVLKTMNYPDFASVVVNGRKNVNTAQESVMPSFGTNPN